MISTLYVLPPTSSPPLLLTSSAASSAAPCIEMPQAVPAPESVASTPSLRASPDAACDDRAKAHEMAATLKYLITIPSSTREPHRRAPQSLWVPPARIGGGTARG